MIGVFTIALLTAEFGQVWAKLGLQNSHTTLGQIVRLHNCAVADKGSIALRTDPKNRTSHGRPPARLRQTLPFVLKIREEKRPKTE